MKNKVLKSITWLSVLTLILAISAYDMDYILSIKVMILCIAWLVPFMVANKELLKRYE